MGRMERINEAVKREISLIIQEEISDPRLEFVTITGADVSADLQYARITYSVLGSEQQVAEAGEVLSHASSYIRRLVGQRVHMRYVPEIHFAYDQSIAYGARIEQTIQEIHDAEAKQQKTKQS